MQHLRIGVIGCGLRADSYLYQLRPEFGRNLELAALADPSPVALETFARTHGNGRPIKTFTTGPELIARVGNDLDALIITSPNRFHCESLIPALEKNLVILLEKPVATTIDDCKTMWQAYVKAGQPPLLVGFVLRYAPFYTKAKELIDSGLIGQILSLEACEMIGPPLTAVFVRGGGTWSWRRSQKESGSFLLEKCCHDMDILSFLTGQRIAKVSSFASRTRFLPDPKRPMHCRDCSLAESCRYYAPKLRPYQMGRERTSEMADIMPSPDDDFCVFNTKKDIPDHQVLNLFFDHGITATFSVVMDQPKTTRALRIFGTEGQIVGEVRDDVIHLRKHSPDGSPQYQIQSFHIEHDSSGHDGADSIITDNFKAALRNEPARLVGLKGGIEAVLVALAAEKSRSENRIVDMADIYRHVFG